MKMYGYKSSQMSQHEPLLGIECNQISSTNCWSCFYVCRTECSRLDVFFSMADIE